MLIVIAGERCTGKSALARAIMEKIHAEFFAGRDYVRLASTEPEAVNRFQLLLAEKQYAEDYPRRRRFPRRPARLSSLKCPRRSVRRQWRNFFRASTSSRRRSRKR